MSLDIWLFLILGDMEKALTVSCLEYEPTIPAKFMIGTDQGVALGCSRKAKCQAEYILNTYQAHYGPIRALQRNPCYTKVTQSVFHFLYFVLHLMFDIIRTFLQLVTGVQEFGLRTSMKVVYFGLTLELRSNQRKSSQSTFKFNI